MLERLQKIIARAGIASRRHAEELIRSGQVRVNGQVVTELGAKADPERDRVEAAGQVAHRPAEATYYLLHKPAHVVATMSDPEGRATLRHVLRGLAGGVFPVGRLEYDFSGLILLTSDGVLADRIFKASARIPKVYWMKIKGILGHDQLREIGHRSRARLRRLRGPSAARGHADNPWYEVELSEARKDVLRRELFAAGHPVEKMKRVQIGPLELGNLPEGHYRELAPSEVARLRAAIERAEKAPQPVGASGPKPPRPFLRKARAKDAAARRGPKGRAEEAHKGRPGRPDSPPRNPKNSPPRNPKTRFGQRRDRRRPGYPSRNAHAE